MIAPDYGAGTLPTFFERVYVPMRLLGRSPATVADMRSFCALWQRIMGDLPLAGIDLEASARFIRSIAPGRSPFTANKHRCYLLAILREARRAGVAKFRWLRRVPTLPEEQPLPTAWTREQVERILIAAAEQPGDTAGIPLGLFLPSLLLVVLNTSLRIGAALTVRTADVDVGVGSLIVRGRGQKNRRAQFFRLGPRTIQAIQRIYDPAREFLFPWSGHVNTLRRRLRTVCRLAGVPAGGHSGLWHRGRCTAISHAWLLSPEYARQLAGHASITTTQNHYVDPRILPAGDVMTLF